MHSLETNYDFINTLSLFENHIKNNFTQLTFKFQIKLKKLDTNLVESTHTNNRANLYYHVFDSSKHDVDIEYYKQFTMSSNIAKRKSEGIGISTLNKFKRVQRSGEGVKQLFPKECRVSIYSGAIRIKYNNLFPRLLTLQTSTDAIVRFTIILEDRDILKTDFHGKLLEREFRVHDTCYREYTGYQRMKQ